MLVVGVVVAVLIIAFLWLGRVPEAQTIDASEAARRIKADESTQLLDVRTDMEFRGGHLAGAIHIPLQELSSRLPEIDKDKPIIVYCRSGHRSGLAMASLRKHGFQQAVHIGGGILAWEAAGEPIQR